jgi:hypothetical protein
MENNMNFTVSIGFEKAHLPPFQDILVLGRKCPVGMSGITKSLDFLLPDGFEVFETDSDDVEALVVNKSILKRMPFEKIVKILEERVFPFMCDTEMIKVDFSVKVSYENLPVEN